MRPTTSYLVCATPRSGSTLLCHLLDQTGIAGHPQEYFEALRHSGLPRRPEEYFDRRRHANIVERLAFREMPDAGPRPQPSPLWNAESYAKIRTIPIDANGGTHALAFSRDGKLMAIGSLIFDRQKPDNPGTSIISLANVGSGVVQWRRTNSGGPRPVAFYNGAVFTIDGDGQSIWVFARNDGKILTQLTRAPDPRASGCTRPGLSGRRRRAAESSKTGRPGCCEGDGGGYRSRRPCHVSFS